VDTTRKRIRACGSKSDDSVVDSPDRATTETRTTAEKETQTDVTARIVEVGSVREKIDRVERRDAIREGNDRAEFSGAVKSDDVR